MNTPFTIPVIAFAQTTAPTVDPKPTLTAGPATATSPDGTATTAVPATGPGAPPPAAGGGQQMMLVLLLVLVGGMMLFTMVNGSRERKKRSAMLNAIKKHDKVLTVGGIVGSVVEMKDDTVILKVDEQSNTRITFSKTAISQVLAADSAA